MSAAIADLDLERARLLVESVLDPELPPLTIGELGIVRGVDRSENGGIVVSVTPTYSGCPAVEYIEARIAEVLDAEGFTLVRVERVFTPAWSSSWMSELGRAKLTAAGIAPPRGERSHPERQDTAQPVSITLGPRRDVAVSTMICPRCDSRDTTRISAFGSTACKDLYRCNACLEPFDHFKEI